MKERLTKFCGKIKKGLKDNACAITGAGLWGLAIGGAVAPKFGSLGVPFVIACLIGGWTAGKNLDNDIIDMRRSHASRKAERKQRESVLKLAAEIGGSPYEQ